MIRSLVLLAFALLFTFITGRLAFGGFDVSLVFAAVITVVLWWQVLRRVSGKGLW